ncbi:J domain-containing protein [uncultured Ramlibacter sp.]|uniref:J domain-containing protein n=1 Tax=uncultured Ramlibacter sp. TaxID=260755 RepID=UPI00262E577A|nr:J domain-containing protein [uncultured Ramlibacter sp.]
MGASGPTHYDTLSVAPQAAPDAVRLAYRRQAQKYHPDRQPDGAAAQQRMAQINEAYAVLSHPQRRASYDRWMQARAARIEAQRTARELAQASAGLGATWPWALLCATIAFALLSVATVLYKTSGPRVIAPMHGARAAPALAPERMAPVAQAATR